MFKVSRIKAGSAQTILRMRMLSEEPQGYQALLIIFVISLKDLKKLILLEISFLEE